MEPLASQSVVEIKCFKTQSVLLSATPQRYNLVPVTQDLLPGKRWGADVSGHWRPEERSPRMSREQSDGEDDVVGTEVDRVVEATGETEVELCLPLEADM